ncbi:2850_t:CDS:2 [Funneliformis geosporum]|uniref:2850_t:CDS:1 n=1 Tax=Funneliformis geosporum TaxID=1117311 RepID=A0A9W4WLT4_9GLOM|nr:2850_t:CDS:2 [Funneliformis geosporum]
MGKLRPNKRPFQFTIPSPPSSLIEKEDTMTTSTAPKQQTIELIDLDLTQLSEVKKQLEEELSHLTSSFGQLKQVQSRFQDCIASVETIKGGNAGELVDTDKVIVDIGTGYYIEKNLNEAVNFYTEKVEFVKKNSESLQQTITSKQNNLKRAASSSK